MRTHIIAAILLASASTASAQTAPERPIAAPPAVNASFEQRNDWCQKYAEWYVSRVPDKEPTPADVRPTHRLEVEVQFCQPNPPEYQRLTIAELNGTTSAS
ncbi:hypothetical protein U91I_03423 [alpha proteobacterium U9-1i]|nr:hypothetical protein U91I_03423 [alpha proteobacterium U9-1i]